MSEIIMFLIAVRMEPFTEILINVEGFYNFINL